MSKDRTNDNQGQANEEGKDSPELTEAELDQVAGAGYPQGENTPDYSRWGIGG